VSLIDLLLTAASGRCTNLQLAHRMHTNHLNLLLWAGAKNALAEPWYRAIDDGSYD